MENFRAILRDNRSALILLIVAFLFLVVCTIQKRGRLTTNPVSRIATVERLVEAKTFALKTPSDSTPFPISIDHVKFGDALYSSKPPSYPMLMAAESMPVKWITGWEFYQHRVDFVRLLVLINQILPYMLAVWCCLLLLREWGASRWTQTFMVAALTFGLLPFGYAPTINNHTVSTSLYLIAFFFLWRIIHKKEGRWPHFLLVGLMAGFAFANELTSGVMLVLFLALLIRQNWRLTLFAAIPAAALSLLPDAIGYHLINGTVLPSYLDGSAYRYEGSYWTKPQGFDALREAKPLYLLKIMLGHHGLFSLTPLLLVPIIGAVRDLRDQGNPLRHTWLGVLVSGLATLIYITFTSWNYGGDCIGMRWLLYFMPFCLLLGWRSVERLQMKGWGKVLLILLLLMGVPWVVNAAWDEAFIQGWSARLWLSAFGGY